jgi:hypothetical protein
MSRATRFAAGLLAALLVWAAVHFGYADKTLAALAPGRVGSIHDVVAAVSSPLPPPAPVCVRG